MRPGVAPSRDQGQRRQQEHGGEVEKCRVPEDQPANAPERLGTIGQLALEMVSAAAHEVVTDVGGAFGEALARGRLPRNLDDFQGDAHLSLAARIRELFDRLPLAIAAEKVHASVGAGRVTQQHLLDQAD